MRVSAGPTAWAGKQRGPRPGGRRLQMLGDEAGPGALARAAAMFGEQQGLLEETEPAPASRVRC